MPPITLSNVNSGSFFYVPMIINIIKSRGTEIDQTEPDLAAVSGVQIMLVRENYIRVWLAYLAVDDSCRRSKT
jgi:hypothetical protein